MIKSICDSFYRYLTQSREESLDSSCHPSEKTPLLPNFAAQTTNPKTNNDRFNPPLIKPITKRPPLDPRLINELTLGRKNLLEFSSSSDNPSILSQSVIAPPDPIKNDPIVKLRALEKKIFSRLIKLPEKNDFVFNGKHSDKVYHIFSCESDLSDWEEEFPNLLETHHHLYIKNLLLKLDRVDFRK